MKITVKPSYAFLFAVDCWDSSSPLEGQFGRVLLKAVPCFPSQFFLSVPDLLSAAVIPPACNPSVVSRALLFPEQGGRSLGMV